MEWIKPGFSKNQVDKAGRILVSESPALTDYSNALQIVNNWRASHNYPLNTFKVTLRKKAHDVDENRIVAQRIKRLSSIELKLQRYKTMQLAQMQELGGCRAILSSMENVRELVQKYERSDLKHKLDDVDDYVSAPKPSGYRGVHMIYKYYSDKQSPSIYNGLNIEIQIRSRLQHAWATAVETVGTFLKQSLKSSQGEKDWLRFFALMGSALALSEGSNSLVPDTPSAPHELKREIKMLANKLNVLTTLRMYGSALHVGREAAIRGDHYFLLKLQPSKQMMTVVGFKRKELTEASVAYVAAEKSIETEPGSEAVLVSVDSMQALERAYPNYFLDTKVFLDEVTKLIAP